MQFESVYDYKISDLLEKEFDVFTISSVDFTQHLKGEFALDKRLERDTDFRPLHAIYSDLGVDYARIRFEFTFHPEMGLMVDRKEWLAYYKTDDSLGTEFLISHRTFDLTNSEEFQQSTDEAIKLREDIVGHIKTTISGVVQALNPTFSIQEIINATDPFFQEYTDERLAFISIGSETYKNALANIDLQSTPHTYLAVPLDPVNAPTFTLRDYIVSMT